MQTCDLEGWLLDLWVARACGHQVAKADTRPNYWTVKVGEWTYWITPGQTDYGPHDSEPGDWSPSTRWVVGGPIIERERIELLHFGAEGDPFPWEAQIGGDVHYIDQYAGDAIGGTTPLVAAMRAFVRRKFGDEIPEQD